MCYFVNLFLVVNASAIYGLKRLLSEVTCYVSLNPTNAIQLIDMRSCTDTLL